VDGWLYAQFFNQFLSGDVEVELLIPENEYALIDQITIVGFATPDGDPIHGDVLVGGNTVASVNVFGSGVTQDFPVTRFGPIVVPGSQAIAIRTAPYGVPPATSFMMFNVSGRRFAGNAWHA
jgi:hypothetical protein